MIISLLFFTETSIIECIRLGYDPIFFDGCKNQQTRFLLTNVPKEIFYKIICLKLRHQKVSLWDAKLVCQSRHESDDDNWFRVRL
jgi:hypothetical protein